MNHLKTIGVPAIPVFEKNMGRGTPMAKRNLPQAFEIDKIPFRDCFSAPSLRHLAKNISSP